MPCRIYLDSSVLCAIADPLAGQGISRTYQLISKRWWHLQRNIRHICTSQPALDMMATDPQFASRRLRAAEGLLVLPGLPGLDKKIELFFAVGALNAKAKQLGREIYCAAHYGVEVFATWDWSLLEVDRLAALRILLQDQNLAQLEFVSPVELLGGSK